MTMTTALGTQRAWTPPDEDVLVTKDDLAVTPQQARADYVLFRRKQIVAGLCIAIPLLATARIGLTDATGTMTGAIACLVAIQLGVVLLAITRPPLSLLQLAYANVARQFGRPDGGMVPCGQVQREYAVLTRSMSKTSLVIKREPMPKPNRGTSHARLFGSDPRTGPEPAPQGPDGRSSESKEADNGEERRVGDLHG